MRPLLRHGDLVAVAPPATGGPCPGDIVLYDLDGKRLMHRVWRRRGPRLWIKDDAGTVSLHVVAEDRVTAVLASGGVFTRGRLGLVFGVFCTAVFAMGRALRIRAV